MQESGRATNEVCFGYAATAAEHVGLFVRPKVAAAAQLLLVLLALVLAVAV